MADTGQHAKALAGGGVKPGLVLGESDELGFNVTKDKVHVHDLHATLLHLLDDLTTRLGIPKTQVIGHADLAPTRKRDPGPLFPWQRLAEAGFGRWPQGELQDPPPGFDPWLAMAAIGYPLQDRAAAVRAFHRHYRGRDDGDDPDVGFDAEDLRILFALSAQVVSPPAR